jgi:hypothetical protein
MGEELRRWWWWWWGGVSVSSAQALLSRSWLVLWAGLIHCRAGSRMPLLGERRRGKTRWMSGLSVMMQAQVMAALTSTLVQKIMLALV